MNRQSCCTKMQASWFRILKISLTSYALSTFIAELGYSANASCVSTPQEITNAFGSASSTYTLLSPQQQTYLLSQAQIVLDPSATPDQKSSATEIGLMVLSGPTGAGGRLMALVSEIGKMMSEPYAFDVFAPIRSTSA